jgi:hypothetical protein
MEFYQNPTPKYYNPSEYLEHNKVSRADEDITKWREGRA